MATTQDFLDDAKMYLAAADTSGMTRNELLAHGALEKMVAALESSTSLTRLNFDIGSLVLAALQEVPWGEGLFRIFYSDGTFVVPRDVGKIRVTVLAGGGSGAGPATSSSSVLSAGLDGGTSSVVGTGVSISALGGQGGEVNGTGGLGGTGGTGGDERFAGGDGGDGAVSGNAAAGGGGGGAGTHLGAGGDGGDAYAADTVGASAGGGGSVFDGGNGSQYGSGGGASAFSAGGTPSATSSGTESGGVDCTGGLTTSGTSTWPFNAIQKRHPFDGFFYAGGGGRLTAGPGNPSGGHGGASSGAYATSGMQTTGAVSFPGPGASGGGAVVGSGQNPTAGPTSYIGGAGGGGGCVSTTNGTVAAGGGGGGGEWARGVFEVIAGLSLAITVGKGGLGHKNAGGRGSAGFVLIEW